MNASRFATMVAALCVIGLTATAKQDDSHQRDSKTQMEYCKEAMPTILKNYNNAKYAVFQAANSGDFAHMGDPVRRAQAALDAMDQPLKACYEALQDVQAESKPDNSN